ncbi:GNAT family N-acetyltransferase [Deinococcus sp. KSM4-11]|uniref:GNAT family N-acetyltransferase n=1 Tax=Deinococcus sp. KSM4-11 TaxID=2568654 RepID=UPI001454D69E|nr:GNAT family N-acetyltransferase [Deinococcus sp. KSM4-11]
MQRTELRTERLLLRPFRAGDVTAALAYRNDPEFARFLPHIPQPFTTRDAERFVAQNMSEPWTTSPTFAVVLDGVLIGTVNLKVDSSRRSGLLGYAIGRAWWGRGLATEAAWAVITWAREAYGLTRVWAEADAQNLRSQRVLQKLGMQYEHFRTSEAVRPDGTPINSVRYGLTFSE